MLTVGFDLDGVICDYCGALADHLGIDETFPPAYDFVRGGWCKDRAEWKAAHETIMEHCERFALQDATAPQAIKELQNSGIRCVGVTARSEKYRLHTLINLAEHGIFLDWLSMGDDKEQVEGLTWLLEDNPAAARFTNIPNVVLVSRPYNLGCQVPYVHTVREFADMVRANSDI